MKLPLLVFSLVVLYWTCIIGAEEDVNSMGDVTNLNEEYESHYQDVPWERSFSRNKRSIIIKPIMDLLISLLGKIVGGMVQVALQPVLYLLNFNYDILTGEKTCPVNLRITSALIHPLSTIKTITCYILNTIGSARLAIMKAIITFITKELLPYVAPYVHNVLDDLDRSLSLPPLIHTFIQIFDIVYNLLKLLGYVK